MSKLRKPKPLEIKLKSDHIPVIPKYQVKGTEFSIKVTGGDVYVLIATDRLQLVNTQNDKVIPNHGGLVSFEIKDTNNAKLRVTNPPGQNDGEVTIYYSALCFPRPLSNRKPRPYLVQGESPPRIIIPPPQPVI